MAHRFEDLHECKPVVEDEKYEKIKKSNRLFNWGGGKSIKSDKSK